ncbi:MAG: hypothetical protein AB7E51_06960 [Pseudodesulfovibrio sp.]|jgi:plastocyanin|uniref:EfeO-type cupredoxin-like domain-containing protein n=1 Tax=Pseudodesulfovibrio indicus TaxID=1716143 RepID=A0A126QMK8_9BACT|nr:hypothetical protein [Pseudodesulfovibrio indicus]AMK11192.1 hypothetical protein AWY79_08715 [Pseudodesulfovibrio indicus]TDT92214.1 hypothetical protein EDC59_101619 [Pseudodesulfovibrio indicus]
MSSFTEADLPTDVHHGEMITLGDGTTVRFESNGEAKNIMVNDGFEPACTLFPGNDYTVQTSQGSYKITCEFGDSMHVEKI